MVELNESPQSYKSFSEIRLDIGQLGNIIIGNLLQALQI